MLGKHIFPQSKPLIVVVGAGIAGLTAALAFSRLGCQVEVIEQSPELREVGAGLQLSPNATHILQSLDLTDRLETRWRIPNALNLLSGRTLRLLASMPLGDTARQRWSAPYAVIHRAGLQRVLADAVVAASGCHLHLAKTIGDQSGSEIVDIAGRQPDLTIIADGVWSRFRAGSEAGPARFTGFVAWRALVEHDHLRLDHVSGDINAYFGPRTHFVTYPLGASHLVNAVAITPGSDSAPDWAAQGDGERLGAHFKHWHPRLSASLTDMQWQVWPLFEARRDFWRLDAQSVLIGDAAHAMTPFAAQGAAMAIEDAYELASQFRLADGDSTRAIAAFEQIRRPRIRRVRRRGDFNRFSYHATGPFRLGRDGILALRNGASLMADFDWLYGYRPSD